MLHQASIHSSWPFKHPSPLTNSDFPTDQTFHQFHDLYTELDLHRIMSGFHGAFATGVTSQQGTLTLPDTWFRPPFWDLLMLQLLRPNSSILPCLYSTFHLEHPLVLSRFCFLPSCLHILSKVFRSTANQHILEVGWIRCGSSKIQRSYWNILNLQISTINKHQIFRLFNPLYNYSSR